MKKIYTCFAVALMALTCTTALTSCESEEEAVARTLEGEWQGTMSEGFYTRWGHYLSGGSYYTYFSFTRYTPTSGYGTEVDEDAFGNAVERDFRWTVEYPYESRHFDIYLQYDSRYYRYDAYTGLEYEERTGPYDAVIYDAYLDGDYFEGYMEDSDGVRKHFRMRYVGPTRGSGHSARGRSDKPAVVTGQTAEGTAAE